MFGNQENNAHVLRRVSTAENEAVSTSGVVSTAAGVTWAFFLNTTILSEHNPFFQKIIKFIMSGKGKRSSSAIDEPSKAAKIVEQSGEQSSSTSVESASSSTSASTSEVVVNIVAEEDIDDDAAADALLKVKPSASTSALGGVKFKLPPVSPKKALLQELTITVTRFDQSKFVIRLVSILNAMTPRITHRPRTFFLPSLLYAQIEYKRELRRGPPNSPGQPRVPDKECTALTVTCPASYKVRSWFSLFNLLQFHYSVCELCMLSGICGFCRSS